MSARLIALIADIDFLLPALVVARQLIAQSLHELADVTIFTVNINSDVICNLGRFYAGRIQFEALQDSLFLPSANTAFHQNHVPATTLAKLALHEVVPARYENIVYFDGDIQIVDNISKLITYRVPMGKILAGRGGAWLDLPDGLSNFAPDGYLANLGDIARSDYFNGGVLAFRRETWADAAPKALKFFKDNSAICLRHDQSALNVVFKGNVIHFRPKYNFHTAYARLRLQQNYKAAIVHFTGPHKPWNSFVPLWGNGFCRPYLDALRDHPKLMPSLQIQSGLTERQRLPLTEEAMATRRQMFFDYSISGSFPF